MSEKEHAAPMCNYVYPFRYMKPDFCILLCPLTDHRCVVPTLLSKRTMKMIHILVGILWLSSWNGTNRNEYISLLSLFLLFCPLWRGSGKEQQHLCAVFFSHHIFPPLSPLHWKFHFFYFYFLVQPSDDVLLQLSFWPLLLVSVSGADLRAEAVILTSLRIPQNHV